MALALQQFAAAQNMVQNALSPVQRFVDRQATDRLRRAQFEREQSAEIANRLASVGVQTDSEATLGELRGLVAARQTEQAVGQRGAEEIIAIDKNISQAVNDVSKTALGANVAAKKTAALQFLNDSEVIQQMVEDGASLQDIETVRARIAQGDDNQAAQEVEKLVNNLSKGWFTTNNTKKAALATKFYTLLGQSGAGGNVGPEALTKIANLQTLLQTRSQRLGSLNRVGFDILANQYGSSLQALTPGAPKESKASDESVQNLFKKTAETPQGLGLDGLGTMSPIQRTPEEALARIAALGGATSGFDAAVPAILGAAPSPAPAVSPVQNALNAITGGMPRDPDDPRFAVPAPAGPTAQDLTALRYLSGAF